jgi:pSer/pThr/pTyr-binding forkhead associated (FHA) protein
MPAQLLALTEGPSILLDKPILLFGRDLECDVRFDSRKISRKHCCLAQVGVTLVVRDLGSTNGVRINGIRVIEGHLKQGDELTVGNHRYQVRLDGVAGTGAEPIATRPPAQGPNTALPPLAAIEPITGPPYAAPVDHSNGILPDSLHLAPEDRPSAEGLTLDEG